MSSRIRSGLWTLGERVAAMTRALPDDRPVDPARHVWVKKSSGRQAGLLVAWVRGGDGKWPVSPESDQPTLIRRRQLRHFGCGRVAVSSLSVPIALLILDALMKGFMVEYGLSCWSSNPSTGHGPVRVGGVGTFAWGHGDPSPLAV